MSTLTLFHSILYSLFSIHLFLPSIHQYITRLRDESVLPVLSFLSFMVTQALDFTSHDADVEDWIMSLGVPPLLTLPSGRSVFSFFFFFFFFFASELNVMMAALLAVLFIEP